MMGFGEPHRTYSLHGRGMATAGYGELRGRRTESFNVDYDQREIGDSGGEVDRCGDADRAKRTVRHHVDLMRLAPSRDLHGLGEATDIAGVDTM
jgi:hypothetical protein